MHNLSVFILVFLIFYFLLKSFLSRLNVRHLRKNAASPPQKWISKLDLGGFQKMVEYAAVNTRIGHIEAFVNLIITLAALYTGLLPFFVDLCSGFDIAPVFQGLALFLIFGLATFAAGIPFSLIHHFGIERRFGFSTITIKTWLTDQTKSALLSLLFGFLLGGAFLLLVEKAGMWWWLYAWLLFSGFQILISFLFPVLLAPIFYKFEPLKDKELNDKIMLLASKAKFPVAGVFQIDASRRSTHSNAFFAGFGKTRRIALFDTLLSQHNHEEILAILAHEIGHWKKGHVIVNMITSLLFSAAAMFAAALLLDKPWLYQSFGLESAYSSSGVKGAVAVAGMILVGVLFMPASFILEPFTSWFSRRHEYQADAYSIEVFDHPGAMEDALFRLSQKNLSNLFPHPLYVIFNYSHPTLFQRVEALERRSKIDAERVR